MIIRSVDLPQPLGPTSDTKSPGSTSKPTRSRATSSPLPVRSMNDLETPLTAIRPLALEGCPALSTPIAASCAGTRNLGMRRDLADMASPMGPDGIGEARSVDDGYRRLARLPIDIVLVEPDG